MYKATVRALLRHSIGRLNQGDYQLLLKLAHPDFELAFPGQNSWSTMFRPQVTGRDRHATHRGIEEATAFADRFVDRGVQLAVEDILVNGPPWNTRIAVRGNSFVPDPDGGVDRYANRAVLFLEIRWGRLVRWEDYEDTERVADWDRSQIEAEQTLSR
ncbi:MAG: nuclear transport factor 2 family protein [Actinomycetota bacterium]